MKLYSKCNLLKKEALKIVVINLKDSDVKDLREKFHEMDFENNGMITASVLKYAMKMLDLPETDDQIV